MSQNIKGVAELELKTDRFNAAAKKSLSGLKELGTKGGASIKSINQPITTLYNKLSSLGSQGKNASDKIRQGATAAKQSMTSLGTSGKMASDQITQSANTAKQSLSTLGAQGRTSMGHLGNAGTKAGTQVSASMSQASTSVRQLGAATQQTSAQMGVMVLGVAALGTSIGTTYTGMTALDKAQLKTVKSAQKLEKAHIGVARANDLLSATQLAVRRFTLSISAMEKAGKTDTDSYAIAVANLALQNQKLTTAYDDLAVKMTDIKVIKESVRIANVDLEDTYTNMTISIFNTVLMSAFLAKTLLPGLSVPTKVVTALTTTLSTTYKLLGPNIAGARMHLNWMRADLHLSKVAFTGASLTAGGFTVAMGGVRIGLTAVSTGLKAMWVALGPIGWAILGIVAAYEIWENNLLGIQDAAASFMDFLHDMWNLLKQISPVVAGLAALYEKVFPPALKDASKATEELNKSQDEQNKTAKHLTESLRKYDKVMANATSTELEQKVALDDVIDARAKNKEAIDKTTEAQLTLDGVNDKHNRRLKETVPLLREIRRRESDIAQQKAVLALAQAAENEESLETIKLQEQLKINVDSLTVLYEQYENSHIGVLDAQTNVNEAVSQGTEGMAAYGEVAYDTAGNVITFDNALVSTGDTMEGMVTPTGTLTGAFTGLGGELEKTTTALKTFEDQLSGDAILRFDERANLMLYSVMALVDGADQLAPAFKQAKDGITDDLHELFGEMYDIYGEEPTRKYAQNFVDMGLIVEGSVDKQIKKYEELNAVMDETKKNYNSSTGLTQATGTNRNPVSTRKGLVTQTFFNSLPAALKGNYRPQSGSVGLPTSLRDSIARRKAKSLTGAGLLARLFSGGFLRRDEAFFWKKFKLRDELALFRDYKKRGFDTKPIFQLLKDSTGSPHKAIQFVKDRIAQDDAKIEAARLQRVAEREESVLFLGLHLGHSRDEITRFSQTEAGLQNFEERSIQKAGISSEQFQNFIKTNSGRQDLSNLLQHQQREDFLAALV